MLEEWSRVRTMSMPEFLERFTLHDSDLEQVELDPDGRLVLEIRLDLVWNRSIPGRHDRLLIRLDRVYRLTWRCGTFSPGTLGGAESRVLDPEERLALLENGDFDLRAYQHVGEDAPHPAFDESVTRTRFEGINWAELEVLHAAPCRFVALDEDGRCVDVSTIE